MPAKRNRNPKVFPIFNAQVEENSMGGGDKIVLKVIENILNSKIAVTFVGTTEGKLMLRKNLPNVPFISINNFRAAKLGIIFAYVLRLLTAPNILRKNIPSNACVWSASDYLPDTLPAFILKVVKKKCVWYGNLFLVARNPFRNEVELNLKNILNFISQRITILMYSNFADQVFVLNKYDKNFLVTMGVLSSKISLLSGGIDLKEIDSVKYSGEKIYDACFIGRFHQQKGIPDLLYAWHRISKDIPNATLAIVGWGNQKETENINSLIKEYNLSRNVLLLGFKDGKEKIKILKASKVLVFPSTFESWGVVIAEALASEIPVVAYRLQETKNNFKQGVVWVDKFNKVELYEKILELIVDPKLRRKITKNSLKFAKSLDWSISSKIFTNLLSRN